jgi:pimeloyl-ACP methyl ester carboxylesterase
MKIRLLSVVLLSSVLLNSFFISNSYAASSLTLELADGVKLDATYYAADKPGPGLLFLNMCTPWLDQTEWTDLATTLSNDGYHILTFDYRGFGKSGGEKPTGLGSIAEAMPYWREHWMSDVQTAYETLLSQQDVEAGDIGIAAASCGVFLGLELMLTTGNVKSMVLLGGPSDEIQRSQLEKIEGPPMLLVTGDVSGANETSGTLDWSDDVFNASQHPDTRTLKYKTETHGTDTFEHHPAAKQMVIDWFRVTVPKN